jgi:hypothetical protein
LASSQVRAMENLAKASGSATIDSSMIAKDIDSLPVGVDTPFASYRIKFQHIMESDGETITQWRTNYISGMLPSTKDDLLQQLESDALDLTEQGGTDEGNVSVGIGDVSIMEV